MNKRRKLIVAIGSVVLIEPYSSIAQQQEKVWCVGFLTLRNRPASLDSENPGAFRQGMRELGYIEGKNLVIEWRFADGKYDRFPGLAAELVQLKVDVIVAGGTPDTRAAQKATAVIPIVMGNVGDPIGSGLIKSLARPGGNITGSTNMTGDIGPKQLELLLGMVPTLSRVAVLVNPENPAHITILKNVEAAARKVGVTILPVEARTAQEIEDGFSMMSRKNAGAVIVEPAGLFNVQRRQISDLAMKKRLPSIHLYREYTVAGGLMSYGPNVADQYRRAASYVDKIFKGAKPGDLPVEQPTKFELIINAKTAKTLGLKIPQSILISADKVIE